jgi:hypothetical protein
MFQAPFFFQQAGGVVAAPAISNRVAWTALDAIWGGNLVLSQAFSSASGNVVFFGCARSTAATTRAMASDWNGDLMTELTTAKQDGPGNLRCEAGLKTGGLVGAGTAHTMITPTTVDNRFRHFIGWLLDLDQVNGGVGGANAAVIAVSQTFVEVSLTVSKVGSLLIAAGWNQEENARPFVWSAGWTKLDEQNLAAGDQPAGSLASKISTATGPQAVRMTGDVANGTWAIAAVEFLPG